MTCAVSNNDDIILLSVTLLCSSETGLRLSGEYTDFICTVAQLTQTYWFRAKHCSYYSSQAHCYAKVDISEQIYRSRDKEIETFRLESLRQSQMTLMIRNQC